jgi:hypothetical protein
MPRTCTVCTHNGRAAIDAALLQNTAFPAISTRFGVSEDALGRHRAAHIPAVLARAQAAEPEATAHALDIVKQLKAINDASLHILSDARKAGDGDLALKAIDRIHKQIELQGKLLGELDDRPQVNVLVLPEWLALKQTLLGTLVAYPAALAAVERALRAGNSAS